MWGFASTFERGLGLEMQGNQLGCFGQPQEFPRVKVCKGRSTLEAFCKRYARADEPLMHQEFKASLSIG